MPKIVDVEQYRQELLEKCFDLFAAQGYANVTTRQIAKELGVSTGSLYHYFLNKEALFEQLAERLSRQDTKIIGQIDRNQSIAERITALGQLLIDNQDYVIKQAVIWIDYLQHCSTKRVKNNTLVQQTNSCYEQAIAELLDLKDLKLAKFIWVLVDGISLNQIEEDESTFATQIELLTQMLIAYFDKNILE